jgi:hypothetical protein
VSSIVDLSSIFDKAKNPSYNSGQTLTPTVPHSELVGILPLKAAPHDIIAGDHVMQPLNVVISFSAQYR